MKKDKPPKLKEYTTNIKPSDIIYTNIARESLSSEVFNKELKVFTEDKDNNLIDLNNLNNQESIELAKELSNLKYRLENPYLTDLCCSLYTQLTTLPHFEAKKIFHKLSTTKNHGVKFWIEKNTLIRLALGNIVNENANAQDGCYKTKKYIMSILTPIFNGTAVVPRQVISLNNYKLENGEIKNFLIKTTPIRILDIIVDQDTGLEHIELELNGLLYPLALRNGRYKTITSYLHIPPNLSVVLSVGEDIYLSSEEYQITKKKTKVEVARRFIDLLQLSYNQPHNLPNTTSKIVDNEHILEVWGDTLKSLCPMAFRTKGKIRKSEIINTANLSTKYFHLGLEHLGNLSSIQLSEHLIIPAKKDFCYFEKNSDIAIFRAYIN